MNIVDYSNTPNLRDNGRSWVLEEMNHIDADPVLEKHIIQLDGLKFDNDNTKRKVEMEELRGWVGNSLEDMEVVVEGNKSMEGNNGP